jgi:hypothetical protein
MRIFCLHEFLRSGSIHFNPTEAKRATCFRALGTAHIEQTCKVMGTMVGSADSPDPDGDHMNNWEEWIAGTDPTNVLSALRGSNPVSTNTPTCLDISWTSVTDRIYLVQRGTNLSGTQNFLDLKSNESKNTLLIP